MIMKKVFSSLFVIVAAMITFAGCAKQEIDAPATPETKTVQFFAESIETKTAFGTPDGTTYPTLWTANDAAVKFSLNYASPKDAELTVAPDFKTASFSADINDDESGAYVFYALSPASAWNSFHATNKYLSANISTTQTPLVNSVDEEAQVLYAVSDQFDIMPSSVSLNFNHFTAYGKLSFVNLNLGTANVTSVAVSSNVNIAGRWNYMVETGEFQVNSGSSEITLFTSNTEDIWFACAPVGSMEGNTLTFTVNTDEGPLSKTVTLGASHNFTAGGIADIKVNMEDVEIAKSVVYDLVEDASELTADSEIIIVASDYDVALSTTQNSNNRGQAGITKSIIDKSTISDPGLTVQVITVEDGTKDGTIAFNVGEGYLCAASSGNNYLRTEATLTDNSSWTVSIADGVATIVAQGTYIKNTVQYNANSSIFACYGGASQKAVSIYKRQGTGSAPLPKLKAPVVTAELNDEETGINVSWDPVDNATSYVISGVGDDVTTVDTQYSFTDLPAGTYTITVTAKAEGYNSARSEDKSIIVPTTNTGDATVAPSGTILWAESWADAGASSTTFTSNVIVSSYTYDGRSGYGDNANSVTYTSDASNNVRITKSSGGNCTSGHLWFNKSANGELKTSAIKLYGATSLTFSHSQGTSGSECQTSYSIDGGSSWTTLGTQSGAIAKKTYTFEVPSGTVSIMIMLSHASSNSKNTRVDNLELKVN